MKVFDVNVGFRLMHYHTVVYVVFHAPLCMAPFHRYVPLSNCLFNKAFHVMKVRLVMLVNMGSQEFFQREIFYGWGIKDTKET